MKNTLQSLKTVPSAWDTRFNDVVGWEVGEKDCYATDYESLKWLHAHIVCTKPKCVVETGTYSGLGAQLMYEALLTDPAFSSVTHKVLSIEYDEECYQHAKRRVDENINLIHGSSSEVNWGDYLTKCQVDFAFIDCGPRVKATVNLLPYLRPGAIVAVHDWRFPQFDFPRKFAKLVKKGWLSAPIVIETERGIGLFQVRDFAAACS